VLNAYHRDPAQGVIHATHRHGDDLVSSLATTHSTKKHIMIQVVMITYPPWSSCVMAPWGGDRVYMEGRGAADDCADDIVLLPTCAKGKEFGQR
jgi:hypothetical protein